MVKQPQGSQRERNERPPTTSLGPSTQQLWRVGPTSAVSQRLERERDKSPPMVLCIETPATGITPDALKPTLPPGAPSTPVEQPDLPQYKCQYTSESTQPRSLGGFSSDK